MAPLFKKHKKLKDKAEMIEAVLLSFSIGVILAEVTLHFIPALYYADLENKNQPEAEDNLLAETIDGDLQFGNRSTHNNSGKVI